MKGILMMTYGALSSIDDLYAFYKHIFHGHEPSALILEEAHRRYRFHTVADPLAAITSRQAQALERRLQQRFDERIKTYVAMKHTQPFIHEAVQQMLEEGVNHIYTLPTSPLFSNSGTGQYQLKVEKAVALSGAIVPVTHISHWHLHPSVVEALCSRLKTALNWVSQVNRAKTAVIFTAHSQPGTPKANEEFIRSFHELAIAISSKLELAHWKLSYRSATPGQTWLGPDVLDTLEEVKLEDYSAVAVCELLSLTENVEALFDCRYDCQQKATELGLEFVSTEFLNDSDDFMNALEDLAVKALLQSHS